MFSMHRVIYSKNSLSLKVWRKWFTKCTTCIFLSFLKYSYHVFYQYIHSPNCGDQNKNKVKKNILYISQHCIKSRHMTHLRSSSPPKLSDLQEICPVITLRSCDMVELYLPPCLDISVSSSLAPPSPQFFNHPPPPSLPKLSKKYDTDPYGLSSVRNPAARMFGFQGSSNHRAWHTSTTGWEGWRKPSSNPGTCRSSGALPHMGHLTLRTLDDLIHMMRLQRLPSVTASAPWTCRARCSTPQPGLWMHLNGALSSAPSTFSPLIPRK